MLKYYTREGKVYSSFK